MKVADYLRIGNDYFPSPPGLRWVNSGEAVEFASGKTFALRQEIALFLEGFGSVRPPLFFPQMLHLLSLVGQEASRSGREVEMLQSMFRLHNRPLRNAGVLCARLCGDAVRSPADPVDVDEVRLHLQSGPLMTVLMCHWRNQPGPAHEAPVLRPEEFEARVVRSLRGLTLSELKHWLQHGRGPIGGAADEVARAMNVVPPRTLGEVFARLARRGRVAAVLPFVDRMVSALALPPRRLEHQELPLGGYADLSTRGQPEQILPSQFALDELEFVRRFAEKELLFFRREEPHKQTREELLIVLDQGVRTWGDVRLLLTAAVIAFARLAQTRKLPFRLTGTSVAELLDPLEVVEQTLDDLMEASDLSLNPGLALERALEEPADLPREVLLLTHPRSLGEEDVRAASRRVRPGTRLFAVAADERGDIQLSELRHGTALAVSRFHVDLSPPPEEAPTAPRPREQTDLPAWTGDVEPVGFPFGRYQVPPDWGSVEVKFDFDRAGKWLLVSGHEGMLQAYPVGGDRPGVAEVLPRGLYANQILRRVDRVLGVAGGFAVCGGIGGGSVLAHYRFPERRVKVYQLPELPVQGATTWYYSVDFHAVVMLKSYESAPAWVAVDLASGQPARDGVPYLQENRAGQAGEEACRYRVLPPELAWVRAPRIAEAPAFFAGQPRVVLQEEDGTLQVEGTVRRWKPFRPQADGRPMFQRGAPLHVQLRAGILAVATFDPQARPLLAAFRGPEGKCLGVFPVVSPHAPFALSADGSFLAVPRKGGMGVSVRDLRQGGRIAYSTRRLRFSRDLQVELGDRSLIVAAEKYNHLFRWLGGVFESVTRPAGQGLAELRRLSGESPKRWSKLPTTAWPKLLEIAGKLRPGVGADNPSLRLRFLRRARSTVLVGVDPFGHLAVFDAQGVLVCLFYFQRKSWQVWMPDGTLFRQDGLDKFTKIVALEPVAQALDHTSDLGVGLRS